MLICRTRTRTAFIVQMNPANVSRDSRSCAVRLSYRGVGRTQLWGGVFMSEQAVKSPKLSGPAVHPILTGADVYGVVYTDADRALFEKFLRGFVPPTAFDAHAHLYDLRHLAPHATSDDFAGSPAIDHDVLVHCMSQWMGQSVVREGLYFPFPVRHLDCAAEIGRAHV